MQANGRTPTPCRVCGFPGVEPDEVFVDGFLRLAACPRCDHRWTEAVARLAPARRRARPESRAAA